MKKLLVSSVIAATAMIGASTSAMAEVSASVGIASTYLWRGYDLGSGTPAISGDLNYSVGGGYVGVWGSSGDTEAGTEYDLYAGYGMEFMDGDLSIDLSIWNYVYPTGAGYTADGETDFGDLTDVILTVGLGPVSLAYYQPVAGFSGPGEGAGNDYNYYTISSGYGAFSFTLGMHDNGDGDDPVHLNVDYSFNDNLTFTLSQFIVDEDAEDDLKFVVSYSVPLM
ncbi:MAG: TorF family putative porin [Spongiibacteraceae bacterium]